MFRILNVVYVFNIVLSSSRVYFVFCVMFRINLIFIIFIMLFLFLLLFFLFQLGLRPKPNLGLEDPNNSRPNAAPKPNNSRHPPAGFPPARARPPTRSAQAWARTPSLRGFFSPPAIHAFHPTCWLVQHPLAVSSWSFSRTATASSQASFAPCTQPRHPCTS